MAPLHDADVIVVGAGLAGLRAAHGASRAGLSVLVFEKGDDVGGRMRTRVVDGYKLDLGFQVILTAYPEIKRLGVIQRLGCRSFSSGARVRVDGRFVEFCDPTRHPDQVLKTLTAGIATLGDFARLFALTRLTTKRCRPSDRSTESGLEHAGFSARFRDAFLRPFLRGVLLDPSLRTDFGLARFYLQMFSAGEAALPSDGIQALPNLLADEIGRSHIRLQSPVNQVTAHGVTLENGDSYTARHVVCAVDAMAATQLGSPEQTMHHVSAVTLYFSAPVAPFADQLVIVSAEVGPIATLALVSNIQPSYAPPGSTLLAISVIGDDTQLPENKLVDAVLNQARAWFGPSVDAWTLLARVSIPGAVVTRPRMTEGFVERGGVLYVGDYLAYPSQNGALQAGRRVAETVIERLS